MIWLRRILAVLLAILLAPITIVGVTLARASAVRSPDFAIDELRKGDVYNFAYDTALPSAIDKASEESKNNKDIRVDPAKFKTALVKALRDTFPPEWVQQQTEQVITAVLPYMTGDTDQFSYTIQTADRVKAAGPALKQFIVDSKIAEQLYDDAIPRLIRDFRADNAKLPFDIKLTDQQLLDGVRRIAPPEWLQQQMLNAIDALVPYVAGQRDTFEVRIPLTDRAVIAGDVVKGWLRDSWDSKSFLFDHVIDPQIDTAVGRGLQMPFGITLASQDIKTTLRQTVSKTWVDQQVGTLVDAVVAYATGTSQTFSVTIPLTDQHDAALRTLVQLVDAKGSALFTSLPPCPPNVVPTSPTCRPAGMSYDQFKAVLRINVDTEVRRIVGPVLPQSIPFARKDLESAIGADQIKQLDDLRDNISKGVVFTQQDIEEQIARNQYDNRFGQWGDLSDAQKQRVLRESEDLSNFNKVRGYIRDGYTFTQANIRDRIADNGNQKDLEDFDSARSALHNVGSLGFLIWIILPVLLLAIGFLGGRTWRSRVMWAASGLIAPALILLIASWPVHNAVASSAIPQAFDNARADAEPWVLPIIDKAQSMALTVANDFLAPIRMQSLLMLVLALVALGGAIGWPRFRKGQPAASAVPPPEPSTPAAPPGPAL